MNIEKYFYVQKTFAKRESGAEISVKEQLHRIDCLLIITACFLLLYAYSLIGMGFQKNSKFSNKITSFLSQEIAVKTGKPLNRDHQNLFTPIGGTQS